MAVTEKVITIKVVWL